MCKLTGALLRRTDVFSEDHSQVRTGTGPRWPPYLAVSLHRLTGATNIAAVCRHISRHPNRFLRYSHNGQINFGEALPD
jgi:hypothetical protein